MLCHKIYAGENVALFKLPSGFDEKLFCGLVRAGSELALCYLRSKREQYS